VAAADRFEWFSEMVSGGLMPIALRTDEVRGFHGEAAGLDLCGVSVSRFAYSHLRSRRTQTLIRQGDPEQYQLALVTEGSMWISQRNGESRLFSNDLVLWDTSRPLDSSTAPGSEVTEALVLQVPKSLMPLRDDRVDRLLARRIPGDTGMGAILAQFLTTLTLHGPDCSQHDLGPLGATAVDLAAVCLAQQLGAVNEAPGECRAQAVLRRIDAFIDQNLGDVELDPRSIAEHHHLSLRSLHALFADRPETVAAYIRRRRLERCRDDLGDPRKATVPVQAVAARWGFASATVFSRAFRAAFGMSPTEYRLQAAGAAARKVERVCTPCTPPGPPIA
jgi:AraC-like DNA-binding protein